MRHRKPRHDGTAKMTKFSVKIYPYVGMTVFLYKQHRMSTRLLHLKHHDFPQSRVTLTSDQIKRICNLAVGEIASYQVLQMTRKQFNSVFVYNRVYNLWSEVLTVSFRKHSDPLRSVDSYLDESLTLALLCRQTIPNFIRLRQKKKHKY